MGTKITPKIKSVLARDKKVMFTTTRTPYPFVADRGEGDIVYDVSGNKFIDFSSFVSVYNLGVNANLSIRNAAKKQIDKLMHAAFTDFYAELPVTFAEKLVKKFPKGFGRVFFSNSGTEANEAAIKFARLFTKRQYTLSFYNAFHGRTLGSLSLTASRSSQRHYFGPFPNTIHVPYAYCYRCPFGKEYPSCGMACLDYIKDYALSKEVHPTEVSAIFIEPMQGEGGYIAPPVEFIKGVREIADDNGMLLVSDEVQSGYMRTGKFLAMDNFGVEADIYTMAKAIAGGLPMGATITRSSLGDIPAGSHANTFGGNLVAVAAANASIDYLNANKASISAEIRRKSSIMFKRLNAMKESYAIIGDVRGLGMMIGIELVRSRETKEPAVTERDNILKSCFNNGLILLPAGISTIRIIPPLTVSTDNLEKGLGILEDAIKEANSSLFR
ncbi:MAG: aminotransferase class III-fold pyridoxal phosphate-dependent enzyme [Candidatus Marsarchaeota archaeon]|jgi:4-aminobutyrate aminotransferase|nr:aminotransferase class III-fold pyridoxal phosphate-dependent enzyme [Candidatus Marsarchaeota archaeon]